jgi:hypothetical protein
VSDRIRLAIAVPADVQDALGAHRAWVAAEVLATELVLTDALPVSMDGKAQAEVDLDGPAARIALTKDS